MKKLVSKICIALLTCLLFVSIISTAVLQGPKDFCQDYMSASYFLHHKSIYGHLNCHDNSFNYFLTYNTHPPFSVLLFVPFALLPLRVASLVWVVLSFGMYLTALILILKSLKWLSFTRLCIVLLLHCVSISFLYITLYQNYTQILLFLLTLAWYLQQKKSEDSSGLLIGLAGLIKIWPAVLLVGLVCIGKTRTALIGILTFCIGTGISLLIFGNQAFAAYFHSVAQYETYWLAFPDNISLTGSLVRFFSGFYYLPPLLYIPSNQIIMLGEVISIVLILLTLMFLVWVHIVKKQKNLHLTFALLLSVLFIAFPIQWTWNTIFLILPITLLLLREKQRKRPWLIWGIAIALLCNPGWSLLYSLIFHRFQTLSVWVTLLTCLPTIVVFFFILIIIRKFIELRAH
jgi:hypothetical protein